MSSTPGTPNNPANARRFSVTVDGVELGSFTSLDGLSAEYEVKTYAEGGENAFVHLLPGRLKYANIKLTRSVDMHTPGLATWFRKLASDGRVGRSTASVVAFNDNSEQVATWDFTGVWPVKYTGPSLAADKSGIATETFEFAHRGLSG